MTVLYPRYPLFIQDIWCDCIISKISTIYTRYLLWLYYIQDIHYLYKISAVTILYPLFIQDICCDCIISTIYTRYLLWLYYTTRKVQCIQYFKLVFLKIQNEVIRQFYQAWSHIHSNCYYYWVRCQWHSVILTSRPNNFKLKLIRSMNALDVVTPV